MAIKSYKPTSAGRRYITNLDSSDITAKARCKKASKKIPRSAGKKYNGKNLPLGHRRRVGAKKVYIEFI